jgi:hypothetical protein
MHHIHCLRGHSRPLVVATILALLACSAGCEDKAPASDVRGNYDLTYDDVVTVRLKVGGAVQEQESTESGTVTFQHEGQPVTVNLAELCAREEVQCPSETLWAKVSVDQPDIDAERPNTHVLNVINNTDRELPAGEEADVVAGLVDEYDRFGLLLGAAQESEGDCGLLAVSTAGGRFSHEGERVEVIEDEVPDAGTDGGVEIDGGFTDDGDAGIAGAPRTRVVWDEGAPVDGIKEGRIKLAYLGACTLGPLLLAAQLELETGFTGTRTGDFDPPPFTPLDPEDVEDGLTAPDGGVDVGDAGVSSDAGA